MNRGTILLRVDASATEGMGRISRCLALSNALQRRRYQMTFISRIDNTTWPDRIRRFRHFVTKTEYPAGSQEDCRQMLAEVRKHSPKVLITDSPNLTQEYLSQLCECVPLLVSIEDSAQPLCYPSGLVLNPMLGHESKDYRLSPGTQLLAGEKYAMIRSEFRRARNVRATGPGGPIRVLLALGGGQVAENTLSIARALLGSNKVEKVDAVLGTSSEGCEEIESLAAEYAGRFHFSRDVRDLGMRMTKSQLLITGGGNTALEAACVGIPMLLVTQHTSHETNATWLEELGVAQYLGQSEKVKPGRVREAVEEVLEDKFERRVMSRSGRMLIDGRGPDRLVTATEILLRRPRKVETLAA